MWTVELYFYMGPMIIVDMSSSSAIVTIVRRDKSKIEKMRKELSNVETSQFSASESLQV